MFPSASVLQRTSPPFSFRMSSMVSCLSSSEPALVSEGWEAAEAEPARVPQSSTAAIKRAKHFLVFISDFLSLLFLDGGCVCFLLCGPGFRTAVSGMGYHVYTEKEQKSPAYTRNIFMENKPRSMCGEKRKLICGYTKNFLRETREFFPILP